MMTYDDMLAIVLRIKVGIMYCPCTRISDNLY